MQNPIFNLAKSLQNNQGNPMMLNNSLNDNMNQMNQMNMNSMNNNMNMMNNQMNMNPMMNNGMMNNQFNMNPMMNPMMMNNMNNMGNNMMDQAMNFNAMNNNMNMNAGNMGNNNQPASNNQNISVYFRAGLNGENGSIMIQCSLDDKISDLIDRYKAKSLQDVSQKKFIFNAKALNKNLKVAEAGLNDGANIFVVNTEGVKGA